MTSGALMLIPYIDNGREHPQSSPLFSERGGKCWHVTISRAMVSTMPVTEYPRCPPSPSPSWRYSLHQLHPGNPPVSCHYSRHRGRWFFDKALDGSSGISIQSSNYQTKYLQAVTGGGVEPGRAGIDEVGVLWLCCDCAVAVLWLCGDCVTAVLLSSLAAPASTRLVRCGCRPRIGCDVAVTVL